MELIQDFIIKRTTHSKLTEVDFTGLEFGKYVADHMLICDYSDKQWHTPHLVPYANLSLDPASLALHYGQTVFEGMKAFRMIDGSVNIFRLDRHYTRFVRSLERMCMAVPPRDVFVEGLQKLVDLDRGWIPPQLGAALYLRPFVYASEAKFGVKVSEQYRFIVITGPVPELYAKPIRVKVERDYVRAAKGGTGFAKCGGNYGAAFYPTQLARQQGYDQVLWTDARENKFIEESGMMNVMFIIGDTIVTPPLSDSILDGVTRDSLLTLAADLGFKTEVRPVSVDELVKAFEEKKITEVFGVGTAAVVAPIQTIHISGIDYDLPVYHKQSVHQQIKKELENIRTGKIPDRYEWNFVL